MAKVSLNKLKLTPKDPDKIITFNEQEIEVKQYLSIEKKLDFITSVLNQAAAADANRFYNPGKVDMFFALEVINYYTNISITEKQKEDKAKLYDMFMSSGLYTEVFHAINENEIGYLYTLLKETIEQIYKYQDSAYGILDAMNTDYNNLDLDINKLMSGLQNKEGIELVDKVLNKLG